MWSELGVGLANHLWQTTIFMAVVGVLTLLLRKNSAAVRYRLWLIASVKFLVPFSFLIGIGSQLGWKPIQAFPQSRVPVAIQQISQPFVAPAALFQEPPSLHTPPSVPAGSSTASVVLTVAWLVGAALVLMMWWFKWARVARVVSNARPFEAPDHLEQNRAASPRIRILSSPEGLEPGIFGIFRPVLLLPEGVARNLSGGQLDSIIAHEIFHVRGRDNLASALHTIVQAMFWFHPLVWWLGNRLVIERERACDEAVLQQGYDPADYAEGILKICKSYLTVPACMAGVSGTNLKNRIEAIMENRNAHHLTIGKKLLLALTAAGTIAVPLLTGIINAAETSPASLRALPAPLTPLLAPVPSPQQNPASSQPTGLVLTTSQNGDLGIDANINVLKQIEQMRTQYSFPTDEALEAAMAKQGTSIENVKESIRNIQLSTRQKWGERLTLVVQTANPPQDKRIDDVAYMITDEERKALNNLTTDQERDSFFTSFWLVRDPTPGTPTNEFKDEYYARIAYADTHFTTSIPGSKSDRGRMYILNGPPDEIVSHPTGGAYNRPGVGTTQTFPFETWRYRHIGGKGDNVIYEFVDKGSGDYRLEYDPAAKER